LKPASFATVLVLACAVSALAQPKTGLDSIFGTALAASGTRADSVPVSVTGVVNGASFQPGISAGSWVTVQGSNLSATTNTWEKAIVNGNLPTTLDGVTVTINGKPAYVYYVSPTQINVQAPTDTSVGTVSVVVNNNGSMSPSGSAQLQTFSPAFFQYSGTNYAIATRYPDNALVANPATIPGTVAAKPGDVIILWGTGFGPTTPPTSAGVLATGAAAATAPTITLNSSMNASVIGTALSPGFAGLYQVAIQLPPSTPTGNVAIQASAGGVQSPAGINIFVGN
jgi:uncharacterized protein (TIGR03437 family)